ncbi:branched-chain amino acid ABC transporter substrate-binding protein [Aquabacterium sp.]|uniref:branched-chain amino acid ABC transporter substrate-binding protein n=1 Tax=Aquabacterium sp. TaxID=1872578 RepID=UPI002B981F97|nr:branched-chain amino acid ABC transporter substrate-binding protein [Aquabacterium sp.]HSW05315.1 branched-chain amino acid ABC transporter substrate-binding protein [Aquabacterium sp.]
MRASRIVIAAIAMALGGAAFLAWPRLPDTLRIGVAAPFSGPLAPQGQDLLDGVVIAVEQINAEGGVLIAGKRVKLAVVSMDDKASPVDGKIAAQHLVDQDVLVAVAHLNSGVSIPAAPLYARAGIPQLAISTKPEYTRQGLPTTLRLVANDDMQSVAMGSYALQMPGVERFAVVDDGTPYGKGLADQAATVITKAGKTIALRRGMDNKTTEFGELVGALAQARVDLLVTTLADFQIKALIDSLAQAGLTRMRILGGDTLKTPALLGAARKVGGVYAASPILEAREFMQGKAFLERFRQRFRHEPVYGAHYTYDAVFVVADALARNGSIDKAALLARLKQFDGHAPVTGTMRFDASGEQRYGSIGIYRLGSERWDLVLRSDSW